MSKPSSATSSVRKAAATTLGSHKVNSNPAVQYATLTNKMKQIIQKWETSTLDGYDTISGLEKLLIEEDYMDSPYWGVFQYCPGTIGDVLKQQVTSKVYSEILNMVALLHKIIHILYREYLEELIALAVACTHEQHLEIYQNTIECLKKDFTMKELILAEVKKMVTFDRKEFMKQQGSSNASEEGSATTAMSNTTLSFYAQSWVISPYLDKAKTCLERALPNKP